MKKFTILLFVLCLTTPVLGQNIFDIVDSSGPPLQAGDTVEVTNSDPVNPVYYISDANYILSYDGSHLADVHIPFTHQHFYIDPVTYEIAGYGDLYVGEFTWADELELDIVLAYMGQTHRFSRNSLPVEPTTLPTPSMSMWGLILLLILVPGYMVFRR